MGKKSRPGLVLLAALILGSLGTTVSPQPAGRTAIRASPTKADQARIRALQSRVSRLPPVRTMVATIPQPAATGTETAGPAASANATSAAPNVATLAPPAIRVIPTVPNRPPPPSTIQYVRTAPAIDREITREVTAALVRQPSIRAAIGSTGSIAPLPGLLRQADRAGNVFELKAFASGGRPLVYDAAQRVYRGTIIVGVTGIAPLLEPLQLPTPVVFRVLDADGAEPMETSFSSTDPSVRTVQVTMTAVRPVRVFSTLIPDGGVTIALQVNPTLAIEVGHGAIDGFGLEATQVNISLAGVARPGGRVVTLHTDAGYLDPTRVQLDAQGNASVTIRSGSVGTARITATAADVGSAETVVRFNFPWITLLASIAGGLAGGFVRSRGRSRWRALAVATVWGLIVFVCYAVGINLLPFAPSVTIGAALVFAVSALGALFGTALLKRS